MGQFCSSFLEETSDSAEPAAPNPNISPSLSQGSSKSKQLYYYAEQGYSLEDDCSDGWGQVFLPCVLESWDFLSYHHRSNCLRTRCTEVFHSESQKEPQVSPGDADSETEEPGQPSPCLPLEASGGGDCPEQDPVSDSPRCLGCWPWLPRAFGRKKQQKCKATKNCLESRRPEEYN